MNVKRKISVVLLLSLLSCNGVGKDKTVGTIEKEGPIDKIQLKDLNEQPIKLENYKGKTVFINFGATRCKRCIEEIPSIAKAQNILPEKRLYF